MIVKGSGLLAVTVVCRREWGHVSIKAFSERPQASNMADKDDVRLLMRAAASKRQGTIVSPLAMYVQHAHRE